MEMIDHIQEVTNTTFHTNDGKSFITRQEAEMHTKKLKFILWYSKNKVDESTDVKNIVKWLIHNETDIKQFYDSIHSEVN